MTYDIGNPTNEIFNRLSRARDLIKELSDCVDVTGWSDNHSKLIEKAKDFLKETAG